jgi:NADPH:quinone reductase-like Zn-dependent oxidoreductase
MKAMLYDRFGSIDELRIGEVPAPVAAPDQALIAMKASSINVLDSRIRSGQMGPLVKKTFPKIPGIDIAGVVAAVGEGVTAVKAGDEVFGATDPFKGGALAAFVAVDAGQLAPKPPQLSFEEAAAIPVAGLAALTSLRELGGIKKGDEVLIHGASGAVGLFAVQIAKHMGARVTAVVGTNGVEAVRAFGADRIIDYRLADGTRFDQRFDIILNASGQMPYSKGERYLADAGRLIEPSPTIPVFIGSKIANPFRRKKHLVLQTFPRRADLETLAGLVARGALQTTIARSYPLDEAREAFAAMEKGGVVGKIVIRI